MDKFSTNVDGVFADSVHKNEFGDEFPVFNVGPDVYYQRTTIEDGTDMGRKRLRVDPDTDLGKFISQSPAHVPFYVKHTDERGNDYIKKIK